MSHAGRIFTASTLLMACSLQTPSEDSLFQPTGMDAGRTRIDGGGSAIAFAPDEGLLLHYPFNESNGKIVHDFAGQRDAILYGEPSWVGAGRIGGALRLAGGLPRDGGISNYVELPRGMLADLDACTIATWFNWNGTYAWERVFDFGNGLPVWIYFSPRDAMGYARVAGRRPDPGGVFIELGTEQVVRAGMWTHLAVTWDRESVRVYVDGKLVGEAAPVGGVVAADLGETSRNWLGKSQFQPGEHPAGFVDPDFGGLIDDFRLYDRVLSAQEISALQTLE